MALALVGCEPSKAVDGPRIRSYGQLYAIGIAIRDYKEEHSQLPDKLSHLVPVSIGFSDVGLFYVTNKLANHLSLPAGWETNSSIIDEYSAYIYVGRTNSRGVIAFERTNLWQPAAAYPGKVAVLFSDFHVEYVPIPRLESWMAE